MWKNNRSEQQLDESCVVEYRKPVGQNENLQFNVARDSNK